VLCHSFFPEKPFSCTIRFWFTLSNGIEWVLQSVLDKPFLRRCECSLQLLRQRDLFALTNWKQSHFIWIENYRGLYLNFIVRRKPRPTQAIKINFQNTYTPNEVLQYMCVSEFTQLILLSTGDRGSTVVNLLAPEFFLILAHPLYKMWTIQEPNTLDLWNKLRFEEEKTMFKIFSTYICWINI